MEVRFIHDLVMLGTQNNSFHRLLEEIDNLIKKGVIKEKVIVQAGYTEYKTTNKQMKILKLMPLDELEDLIEQADLIITHGGVGSITMSLKRGKKVIAVPRLHEYHEHVNNHQKEIVQTYDEKGYIVGVQDVKELQEALSKIKNFEPKKYQTNNQKMLKIIEDFIDKI